MNELAGPMYNETIRAQLFKGKTLTISSFVQKRLLVKSYILFFSLAPELMIGTFSFILVLTWLIKEKELHLLLILLKFEDQLQLLN